MRKISLLAALMVSVLMVSCQKEEGSNPRNYASSYGPVTEKNVTTSDVITFSTSDINGAKALTAYKVNYNYQRIETGAVSGTTTITVNIESAKPSGVVNFVGQAAKVTLTHADLSTQKESYLLCTKGNESDVMDVRCELNFNDASIPAHIRTFTIQPK